MDCFFFVSSSFVLGNTQFTYNTVDDGIEVTGCVGECPNDLVIPEEIDGYPVTIIGGGAFGEKNLSSVIIPDTIVSIRHWAFANNQLSTVTVRIPLLQLTKAPLEIINLLPFPFLTI